MDYEAIQAGSFAPRQDTFSLLDKSRKDMAIQVLGRIHKNDP